MNDRWRQPVIPIAIEKETKRILIEHKGIGVPRLKDEVQLVLKDQDVRRIAGGWVCMNCLEPFPEPFPKKCGVCGYAVRDRQPEDFQRDYQGTEEPLVPLDERLAAMDEYELSKKGATKPQILIP